MGCFDAWRQWAEEADKTSILLTMRPSRLGLREEQKVKYTARQERYTDAGYRRPKRAQAKGCGSGSTRIGSAAELLSVVRCFFFFFFLSFFLFPHPSSLSVRLGWVAVKGRNGLGSLSCTSSKVFFYAD